MHRHGYTNSLATNGTFGSVVNKRRASSIMSSQNISSSIVSLSGSGGKLFCVSLVRVALNKLDRLVQ